ncbi:MAG: hypothetical protein ACYDHN_16255 [Solirubrobacteraceae bacterium]
MPTPVADGEPAPAAGAAGLSAVATATGSESPALVARVGVESLVTSMDDTSAGLASEPPLLGPAPGAAGVERFVSAVAFDAERASL